MKYILFSLFLFLNLYSFAFDFQANGFNFNFGLGEEVTLVSPTSQSSSVIIPEKVTFRNRTFNVTKIDKAAFLNHGISNLIIGEGIKEIGEHAFSGNKFKQLIIPNTVKWIGEYAFANNDSLQDVQLGKEIMAGGSYRPLRYTFANCNNIEKIKLIGDKPIENFDDYPAFTPMVKKFAQVYVPINGIREYYESSWKKSFSLPLKAYKPQDTDINPACLAFYVWDDSKAEKKYNFPGYYLKEKSVGYTSNVSYSKVETTMFLTLMPYENDYIVRIEFKDFLPSETGVNWHPSLPIYYYGVTPKDKIISELTLYTIRNNHKINIDFNWFKIKSGFKKKIIKGCKFDFDNHEVIFYLPDIESDLINWSDPPIK